LTAELDDHLGYFKHEALRASNSINGNTHKALILVMINSKLARRVIEQAVWNPSLRVKNISDYLDVT